MNVPALSIRVAGFLKQYGIVPEGDIPLLLGVSGGVDSMVLLDILCHIYPRHLLTIAHIHHGLRGHDADTDADLVQEVCRMYGVACYIQQSAVGERANTEKTSIETAGRSERYEYFHHLGQQLHITTLLTAHHQNDHAETIIAHLVKGAKIRGLSGIRPSTNMYGLTIMRPLLSISKKDIRSYAMAHSLRFREDSSNTDIRYERNYIRTRILPPLVEYAPHILHTLTELGTSMSELSDWLDTISEQWFLKEENHHPYQFSLSRFQSEAPIFRRILLSFLYTHIHGSSQGLSRGNLDELIRFLTEPSNSFGQKELSSMMLERRGDKVIVTHKTIEKDEGRDFL